MKKRTARRRAIQAYLRKEATKRPYSKAAECIVRQHNRDVHKHNRNAENRRKRQMNELNKNVRRICKILNRSTTPAFIDIGDRSQATADQLQRFKEKYQEFVDQESYALTD